MFVPTFLSLLGNLLILSAVAMGAVTQFRALGGVVGLSIGANVLNSHVKSSLAHLLSPEQLGGILESTEIIAKLPESLQFMIRKTFADGYNLQMKATKLRRVS